MYTTSYSVWYAALSAERGVHPRGQFRGARAAHGVRESVSAAAQHGRKAAARGERRREAAHAVAREPFTDAQRGHVFPARARLGLEARILGRRELRVQRGVLVQHAAHRGGGLVRFRAQQHRDLVHRIVTAAVVLQRAHAARDGHARAALVALRGGDLDKPHLAGARHVRAAARAHVGAARGDDAHGALQRLLAAVGKVRKAHRVGPFGRDGLVALNDAVRQLLGQREHLVRHGLREVDAHAVLADAEAHVLAAELLVRDARQNVLARVLLHVVEAARPVDVALHRLAHAHRRGDGVPDHAVLLVHVHDARSAQRAAVGGLTAALGIKGRGGQSGAQHASVLLAGQHGGAEAGAVCVAFIQSFGLFHGNPSTKKRKS